MPVTVRRSALVAFAVAVSASASSCSSGGDSTPAPACTHAAVPSTGPGDPLDYFPSAVGWTWTYRIESTGDTATMAVTGTQTVGSEVASVFTSSTSSDPTPTVELVVERPAGAYVLADPSETPPFDQLYPSLVIPFPVAVTPSAEQVRCSALDAGDLDGDGKPDLVDLVASLRVFSITETAGVQAGYFVDVAHVQQVVHVTAHTTASGTLEIDTARDDWFAPGVGRVVSLATISADGLSSSETTSLVSFSRPGTVATAPGEASPAAAPTDPAPSLAKLALRLARSVLQARR